ncbi:MAG: Glycogen phosphorylase [Nitrospirae bacterium]|nr:MAG: alpha-glucan phosphorylase [Nitrospira sp. OLB3]MBV6471254.1 Glycogen phosphorylase [Nitrospirota bacterium]MCK6491980.1 alpha-glucan family phosphorylase [Nitrospira sp.]MEB2338886.1 alpha-glucan family phosphorylase [Nitrospirales bacterium]
MDGRVPQSTAQVAYFSMEIGLNPLMPTYAGGLGVLAGDTLRSAADLEVPMVGVTLLHRRGYFYQRLDRTGWQSEEPVAWAVHDFVDPLDQRVSVEIEGRRVQIRAWRYLVKGMSGYALPVYLLDTDLPENSPFDRSITDSLYGGDAYYRLCQELVLGFGGFAMLRALGYGTIFRYHLNEGHAALLVPALLEDALASRPHNGEVPPDMIEKVREQCIFTTHTPVPAGHDQFSAELAHRVLGSRRCDLVQACQHQGALNMTLLALRGSRYVNGVAMRHGEVSHSLYPGYPIHSITNGVHAVTWAAPSFQNLYDRHLPEWRYDQLSLRYAISIPGAEIWAAHREAKLALVDVVNRETNAGFDRDFLTIGFARRATAYKRGTLVFHDLDRLRRLAKEVGPIQFVFAGKAHPQDQAGKELIRRIHEVRGQVPVAYLPNYDMGVARLLCAGVDVWLNTPLPPMEASGTSGMKAAMNGVPSLSVLDGWWVEGHIEGVTGWAIGAKGEAAAVQGADLDAVHAAALYDSLERRVLPLFYRDREGFIEVMKHTIAINGAFFNTQRMVGQYLRNAYRLTGLSANGA